MGIQIKTPDPFRSLQGGPSIPYGCYGRGASKNPNKVLEVKQAFEDGNTVITHSHVKQSVNDIGAAVVHIFRFEDGHVVELWDLGQQIAKDSPNENGAF